MNDVGTQKYDNMGLPEGMILSANNVGTQKYDNMGLPEGFPGTNDTRIRLLLLLGVGT
nr:MAG: hypothetical protein [Podoviridae sp. ctka020]